MSHADETGTETRRAAARVAVMPRVTRAGRIRRRTVILAVAATPLLIFPACGNGPSAPGNGPDPVLPYLLGEWAWVCSTGGIAGETVCAATSGMTSSWEFRTDSLFRWMRNDTSVLSGRFRVVREPGPAAGDSLNRLVVDGVASISTIEMPDRNHLHVTETCADCYSSTWTRVR